MGNEPTVVPKRYDTCPAIPDSLSTEQRRFVLAYINDACADPTKAMASVDPMYTNRQDSFDETRRLLAQEQGQLMLNNRAVLEAIEAQLAWRERHGKHYLHGALTTAKSLADNPGLEPRDRLAAVRTVREIVTGNSVNLNVTGAEGLVGLFKTIMEKGGDESEIIDVQTEGADDAKED